MRRIKAVLAAAALAATSLLIPQAVNPPEAAAEVDIYITPGTHFVNGREWRTTCEPYSQTRRCRTEIKATVIHHTNGRFTPVYDWAFNNLTYAASPRTLWSTNPLGGYGRVGANVTWTGTDGRQWRTECDTALTGVGGCRSFRSGSVIERVGSSYRWVTKEVFNNMVRFGSSAPIAYPKAPPMSAPPAFLEGRRHFRLGLIVTQQSVGDISRGHGRISNLELDPGGRIGTFREGYWQWSLDNAPATQNEGDWGQFRASVGNLPTGCLTSSREITARAGIGLPALPSGACDVRAARTFLQAPTVRTGTYEALPGNAIKLYFDNSSLTETYLDASAPSGSYSELRLSASTHPGAVSQIGFMFGSRTAPGAAVSMAPLTQGQVSWLPPRSVNPDLVNQASFPAVAGNGADKSMWYINLGRGDNALSSTMQYFRWWQYQPAAGNTSCVVTTDDVRRTSVNRWHSYLCPQPSDGKLVWLHMVGGLVAERHDLCGTSLPNSDACKAAAANTGYRYTIPARAGGHVNNALQILDDAGNLVGMVNLETSLYNHNPISQSQLALLAVVRG